MSRINKGNERMGKSGVKVTVQKVGTFESVVDIVG